MLQFSPLEPRTAFQAYSFSNVMPASEANVEHELPLFASRYLLQLVAIPLWVGPGAPEVALVAVVEEIEAAAVDAT